MKSNDSVPVYVLGSMNVDHVFRVPHLVRPGETLGTDAYGRFAGGKGLNQSVALRRAGVPVRHIGCVGDDGRFLLELLRDEGVEVRGVEVHDGPSGQAFIQVDAAGENSILLLAGANRLVSAEQLEKELADASPGDWFLAQNESNLISEGIRLAKSRGLKVAFNPAPMGPDVAAVPFACVDLLILNETEAMELAGNADPQTALSRLHERYPALEIVLTQGSKGACSLGPSGSFHEPSRAVRVEDTTAAGDCFVGYFLAAYRRQADLRFALRQGCRAAELSVGRPGAMPSIPRLEEVRTYCAED